MIVCAWAQSLWAKGLSRWFKTAGRLSPKADGSVICRHAFTTHIFAWLMRSCESVVWKIRFDHRVFDNISTMEPLQKFFRVLLLKNFEIIRMPRTCAATKYVRKASFTLRTVVLSRHYIAANLFPILTVVSCKRSRFETNAACKLRPGETQKRLRLGFGLLLIRDRSFCDRVNGITSDSRPLSHVT